MRAVRPGTIVVKGLEIPVIHGVSTSPHTVAVEPATVVQSTPAATYTSPETAARGVAEAPSEAASLARLPATRLAAADADVPLEPQAVDPVLALASPTARPSADDLLRKLNAVWVNSNETTAVEFLAVLAADLTSYFDANGIVIAPENLSRYQNYFIILLRTAHPMGSPITTSGLDALKDYVEKIMSVEAAKADSTLPPEASNMVGYLRDAIPRLRQELFIQDLEKMIPTDQIVFETIMNANTFDDHTMGIIFMDVIGYLRSTQPSTMDPMTLVQIQAGCYTLVETHFTLIKSGDWVAIREILGPDAPEGPTTVESAVAKAYFESLLTRLESIQSALNQQAIPE